MFSITFVMPAVAVGIAAIVYLSLDQSQRRMVLRRLQIRGRRTSSADTPPRSLSPGKQNQKTTSSSASEILSTFPPSQRDQLKKVASSLSEDQKKAFSHFQSNQAEFPDSLLGFEEDYNTAPPWKYSYAGISVQEIKALGNFPDYAALSEVPMPSSYAEFDIDRALPRPYRPFRWAYHQTMSLTKLETDWWIELENTYRTRIQQRKQLYVKHGNSVLDWLPGSELACKELMETILQFLCARYPQYFILSPDNKTLENKILNTIQNVQDQHPLLTILDNVPEDYAIMLRNPETGYYHFRAGVICSALGWNLGTKLGMQLHEIHAPIPDYKEKMQFSMDRFFTKMPTCKPIQRGSWGLEVDQPLYMPPGDPHEEYRDFQNSDLTIDRCHLRVDWQTLRRLPLSGAIVFNFKALFTPVSEFRDEPYIPSLLLKILREGKENLMKYKNTWHVEHVVIPALEKYEREQKLARLIEDEWDVRTLDESPWFPGWQEKWHRQQGF